MSTQKKKSKSVAEPLYRQVAETLRRAIVLRRYVPSQRLPDERQLAREHSVSRATIRLALDELERDRIVRRVQGSGTYVEESVRRQDYVCLFIVGPEMRRSLACTAAIAAAEQSVRDAGWHLIVRYEANESDLVAAMEEAESGPAVIAGILMGQISCGSVLAATGKSRIPWVKVGKFIDDDLSPPIVDQVVFENYRLGEQAAHLLLRQHVRRFVLVMGDTSKVYQRDFASGYCAVLEAAGIEAGARKVIDLSERVSQVTPHESGVSERSLVESVIQEWRQVGWPEGIVMPFFIWEAFMRVIHDVPPMRHAWDQTKVAVTISEEMWQLLGQRFRAGNVTWLTHSLKAMTDQAVIRLQEQVASRRPPVRDYLRSTKCVTEEPEAQPLEASILASIL